jgi:uncharacterized membrane protein
VANGVPPNDALMESFTRLDRVAVVITDRIGTMGFFFMIAGWTVIWCGYNILASKAPSLHLHAFDPFPAFVAYLLISNVIQIMLMPLLMVGQNLQGRHSEARAENDYQVNQKAFADTEKILKQLEAQAEQMLRIENTNRQILEHLAKAGSSG